MLRFHSALTSVLAAAIVPAVFLGQGTVGSLEQALGETARALEVLGGLLTRAEQGDPRVVGFVRSVTEPPLLDAQRRDERLVDLRNQVNLLQTELDVLQAPALLPDAPVPAPAPSAESLPPITAGLSRQTMDELAAAPLLPDPATRETRPAPHADVGPDYSADPVAHARACYYARRYEQCLKLVAELEKDAEASFWKGRALEKLGRLDEAVEAVRRSAELAAGGPLERRARAELEFLEWRRSFLADAPHRQGERP